MNDPYKGTFTDYSFLRGLGKGSLINSSSLNVKCERFIGFIYMLQHSWDEPPIIIWTQSLSIFGASERGLDNRNILTDNGFLIGPNHRRPICRLGLAGKYRLLRRSFSTITKYP